MNISFSALLLLLIIEFKFQVKFFNMDAFKLTSFLDTCILQKSEGQGPSASNTTELYVRVPAAPLPSGDIELPIYYVAIDALLDEGNIMPEWDKFIEETAYHVLSFSEFKTKDQYHKLGRIMAVKYPCMTFFAVNKTQPWVSIVL
jgi:hypothetical protein